ncbi:hypothetical protein CPB85DRAFT_1282848, partial [Mucidula mucida]
LHFTQAALFSLIIHKPSVATMTLVSTILDSSVAYHRTVFLEPSFHQRPKVDLVLTDSASLPTTLNAFIPARANSLWSMTRVVRQLAD